MKLQRFGTLWLVLAASFFVAWFQARAQEPAASYSGGDGSTIEKAIVIKAKDLISGSQAEYDYVDKHFPGNTPGGTDRQSPANHRQYDRFTFTTNQGEKKSLYFDVTGFADKL